MALLVLGQAITPARPVDEPVRWPTGENVQVAQTSGGFAVMMKDDYDRTVLRIMRADGTFSDPVSLGVTQPSFFAIATSLGVLVFYETSGGVSSVFRLFDGTTGAPIGPPNVVSGALAGTVGAVSGSAGRLISIRQRWLPDAGRQTYATRMNDDGTDATSVDLPPIDTISRVTSNATGHWVAGHTSPPDGGWGTFVLGLDDLGAVRTRFDLVGLLESMVATDQYLMFSLSRLGAPRRQFVFTTFDGTELGVGPLGDSCVETVGRPEGDEIVLACADLGASLRGEGLRMLRVRPDGGSSSSLLWVGDGGQHSVRALVPGFLFFERTFAEIHRGNWKATYVMPLSSDSLTQGGPSFEALMRPSSQSYPSFATRERGLPNAIVWNDDRKLPREPLLEAASVSSSGVLGPVTDLERLYSQFTAASSEGRSVATDGTAFMAHAWNGFDIEPLEWSFDGGAPIRRPLINPQFGIYGTPFTAPASEARGAGYFTSWTTYPQWYGRRTDSRGTPLASQVPISGAVLDVLAVGERQLQALTAAGGLRIVSVDATGANSPFAQVVQTDAGINAARMAKSGSTLMIAWNQETFGTTSRVFATRFTLDGGSLDATPFSTELGAARFSKNVRDIGVRDGVFYILGLAGDDDGGSSLWVWRPDTDGGSQVYRDINQLNSVVAGPTNDDGSLLIAYSQNHPGWNGAVQRTFLRSIGETVAVGSSCERDSDCTSTFCTAGFCCATKLGCAPDGGSKTGIEIYQLGCACDASGASAWWLIAAWLIRRARIRRCSG